MKVDMYKMFGVEEDEEFKVPDVFVTKFRIHKGTLEFFNDEWQVSNSAINTFVNQDVIKLPKKQFSQETINFFNCLDRELNWIAKDKDGTVNLFSVKPRKRERAWDSESGLYGKVSVMFKNSLFEKILWEDEEPVYIPDYLVETETATLPFPSLSSVSPCFRKD